MIDLIVSVLFWWIPWVIGFAIFGTIGIFAGGFAWYLAENWIKRKLKDRKWLT